MKFAKIVFLVLVILAAGGAATDGEMSQLILQKYSCMLFCIRTKFYFPTGRKKEAPGCGAGAAGGGK